MTFRIFVNDRSRTLYSGLVDVEATTAASAVEAAKRKHPPFRRMYGLETYVAIEWPPRTTESLDWLERYVNREDAA